LKATITAGLIIGMAIAYLYNFLAIARLEIIFFVGCLGFGLYLFIEQVIKEVWNG